MAEYENLWRSDPQRYGCVSIHQACNSLRMDAESVSSLGERGVLECLDVAAGSHLWSMVTLETLLKFKAAQSAFQAAGPDRPREILRILTEAARGRTTVAYGELMEAVGYSYQEPSHRHRFKQDLRKAVQQSEPFAQGLLLSALALFKIQHIAEDDFFLMAKELNLYRPDQTKSSFWKEQVERLYAFYAADRSPPGEPGPGSSQA